MAKFIAQIDTGTTLLTITRAPAEATSPAKVKSSGSPAATRAPNASTSMAIVTGHDMSSEVIIASRFAELKSAHSCDEPVGVTSMPFPERLSSGPARSSAARTISLVEAPAPPSTTAVLPSREIVAPGWGGTTDEMRSSARRVASTLAMMSAPAPKSTGASSEWTTIWRAELALPPKWARASSRTSTDSEPSACHPAPESDCSTWGAKTPSPRMTTTQIATTSRPWPMTAKASLPSMPTDFVPSGG